MLGSAWRKTKLFDRLQCSAARRIFYVPMRVNVCLSKKILRSRIFSFLCIRLCCNGKEDRAEETRRVCAFVRVSLAENEAFRQAAMQRCAPHFLCDCAGQRMLMKQLNLCDDASAPCIDLSLRVPPQLRPQKAGKPHPSRCSAAPCPTPHY